MSRELSTHIKFKNQITIVYHLTRSLKLMFAVYLIFTLIPHLQEISHIGDMFKSPMNSSTTKYFLLPNTLLGKWKENKMPKNNMWHVHFKCTGLDASPSPSHSLLCPKAISHAKGPHTSKELVITTVFQFPTQTFKIKTNSLFPLFFSIFPHNSKPFLLCKVIPFNLLK